MVLALAGCCARLEIVRDPGKIKENLANERFGPGAAGRTRRLAGLIPKVLIIDS